MSRNRILDMFSIIMASIVLMSCNDNTVESAAPTDPLAQEHWYDGKAEISSYKLEQARYGEVHKGQAVMIFVTEDFSKKSWTKADNPTDKDVPVMKLNFTKNFNTGIYPYSMMLSTFFPFNDGKNAVKVSASMQEWCGHTYMELRNKKQFEVRVDSYFEGESEEEIKLDKTYLEDDFWTIIRLNPENLPIGNAKVIPSFFYVRLAHVDLKAYDCKLSTQPNGEVTDYQFNFPDLERSVTITYETAFPHKIMGWKETYFSGWGDKRQELTTTAELNKSIRTDYWTKNSVADSTYRTELGLE
ncbi:MAG: septum formation inhibitor Maf [Crocinitomix sp.]|nr:septum formation inhibitor Maf [Crocinitomix sp.]